MWWLAPSAIAQRSFLPLESLAYEVDVTGPVARVEVVETFRNTTDGLVDAVYVFPLAPGAAIDSLHIRVGTREIDGTVRARDAARAEYEAARAEGRTAALTEDVGSDVFTQDVANLPPGEAVVVRFSVVQPVERVDDHWTLTLPLLAPPRFLPLGAAPVLAALRDESPRDVGVRADVSLTVQAGAGVRDLWAAPLPRDVRPDLMGSAARLRLDDLPLDADLVVGWKTARDRPAVALLVSDTHALLVAESGLTEPLPAFGVDWSGCSVVDETQLASDGGSRYRVARRLGECRGPVDVAGLGRVWPRAVVDEHTLATAWARAWIVGLEQGGDLDEIRRLGLEYGLVTSQTSFVAVDQSGPTNAAPRRGPDPWVVSSLDRDGDALLDELDAEDAKREEFAFAEPVEQVPRKAKEVDVVEALSTSSGVSLDTPASDLPVSAPGPVAAGAFTIVAPAPGTPLPGWSGDGRLEGPVGGSVRLRAEGAASRAVPDASPVVPGGEWRSLGFHAAGEPWSLGASTRSGLGAAFGTSRAWGEVGTESSAARLGLEGAHGWLAAEVTDRLVGKADVRVQGSGHTVTVAGSGGAWRQADGASSGTRSLGSAHLGEAWRGRPGRLAASVDVESVGDALAVVPRAELATQGDVWVSLGGGRAVEAERVAVGGVFPSAWDLGLGVGAGTDTTLSASATVVRERAVLVLPLALDPSPEPGPTVERTVPVLAAAFQRAFDGWGGRVRVEGRPWAAALVSGDDPRAAFTPGWLLASTPFLADAELGGEVFAPWTLRVTGRLQYRPALDDAGPWWLRTQATAGLDVDQALPVRRFDLHLVASVAASLRDPAEVRLPTELLVLAPFDLAALSPWRAAGALRLTF